ncbi:MAG: S1C family serine protease [Treponema sp.]|jgi:S1-C subfamily serine protease|nr:S1C family serine protease [Treponema sp.]
MNKTIKFKFFLSLIAIVLLTVSCGSLNKKNENSFSDRRTTSSIRLGNIGNQISNNPVDALNLIYIYKEVYLSSQGISSSDRQQLEQYEEEAVKKLIEMQETAVEQEDWEKVLSLGRSIANLEITTANTGRESAFYLEDAKKKLREGNNLGAFLSAVKSHELRPMDMESALLFLEKAVEAKQRRTASFFFSAAQNAGGRNIPSHLREYATGQDSVSDMIKGVATVIVDRGVRVERGVGFSDRVGGSAFFIDSSGLLITNYHVIASEVDPKYKGYSRMYLRMGDSTSPRIPARVVGYDKALDLALIKTEIESEYVFSVVDRVIPRVGDTVIAIGSPLGLEKTVTSGIVSALGRRFLQIGDVIQIDAAINSGNSGGPIVDNEGRLVGIAFAGIPQFQGLNFAVPAQQLAAALPAMIKGGKSQRSWLGLTLYETFSEAEIVYTAPNTPAAQHQVTEGSFLRTINGTKVTSSQGGLIPALQNVVFASEPGELVALETIDRNGIVKKHIIITVPRPDLPLLDAARVDKRERIAAPLFGMILTRLPSSLFSSSNFRVDRVIRGSIADLAGVSENDPISINRLRIMEDDEYAVMEINIKKRRMGYLETSMQLPVWLDSPDTL